MINPAVNIIPDDEDSADKAERMGIPIGEDTSTPESDPTTIETNKRARKEAIQKATAKQLRMN